MDLCAPFSDFRELRVAPELLNQVVKGHAAAAVDLAAAGAFGNMTALKRGSLVSIPIERVADRVKIIPADHELVSVARSVGTSFG